MKICHIISNLNVGGAETMLYRLCICNPDQYTNLLVISLTTKGDIGNLLESKGITVVALQFSYAISSVIKFFRLVLLLSKFNPDVVQTWMYHANLLGGLASKIINVKALIWSIHSVKIPQGKKSLTYLFVKISAFFSSRIPDLTLFCADSAKIEHIENKFTPKKNIVIPNGYDFDEFIIDKKCRIINRHILGIQLDEIVIGVVGRYDKLKDYNNFIEAANIITDQLPKVRFLMVGI